MATNPLNRELPCRSLLRSAGMAAFPLKYSIRNGALAAILSLRAQVA